MGYGHRFVVTALRRTGQQLIPTSTSFTWTLQSRALPQDTIVTKLMLHTVREVLPGTNVPVEQVLGIAWEPFDLHGEWNDKFAGSGFAKATYRSFAQFVGCAPLVRLQFGWLSLQGILTELELSYERDNCIGWRVMFSPHLHETVGAPGGLGAIVPTVAKPVSEHASVVQQAASDLQSAASDAASIPINDNSVQAALNQTAEVLTATARVVSAATTGLDSDATNKLLQLAGQFRAVGAEADQLYDMVRSLCSGRQVGFDDPLSFLAFDEWVHSTAADARALRLRSLEAETDMQQRAQAAPLAIYRPKAGEDPYSISRRFYGTPGQWRAIWSYNGLASMVLLGTEELIIPTRAA